MHVELYKIFVFWNMRCLHLVLVSIRSMHVELYKRFSVFWKMRCLVCEY